MVRQSPCPVDADEDLDLHPQELGSGSVFGEWKRRIGGIGGMQDGSQQSDPSFFFEGSWLKER